MSRPAGSTQSGGIYLNGEAGETPVLKRSGSSFLGAIKSIVTAPLSWLNNDHLHDTGDKRSLDTLNSDATSSDTHDRVNKKPRLHSAPRDDESFSASNQQAQLVDLNPANSLSHNGLISMPAAFPASFNRNNALASCEAGPSRTTYGSRHTSSDPLGRALSRDVSMNPLNSNTRRSLSREVSLGARNQSPYRMRTSLTPQAPAMSLSPTRPEFSTSRTSMTWPIPASRSSVSPTRELKRDSSMVPNRKHLIWDPIMGITTKEDLEANSRARTPVPSSPAERALHALDSFRKPMIPPSFANDPAAQTYLRTGRKYAPPPLPSSVVQSTKEHSPTITSREHSSLSGKTARMIRPYSGEGGMKKLLKKRAIEQNETEVVYSRSPLKEAAMQTEPDMIYSQSSSPLAEKTAARPTARSNNAMIPDELDFPQKSPSKHISSTQVGKGLGGRVSASRTAMPTRPSNPDAPSTSSLRVERSKARTHEPSARKPKFAVLLDEDEGMEGESNDILRGSSELLQKSPLSFEIPTGFSFQTSSRASMSTSQENTEPTELPGNQQLQADKSSDHLRKSIPGDLKAPSSSSTKASVSTPFFGLAPPPLSNSNERDKPIGALPFSFSNPIPSPSTAGSSTSPPWPSYEMGSTVEAPRNASSSSQAPHSPFTFPKPNLTTEPTHPVPALGVIPPTPRLDLASNLKYAKTSETLPEHKTSPAPVPVSELTIPFPTVSVPDTSGVDAFSKPAESTPDYSLSGENTLSKEPSEENSNIFSTASKTEAFLHHRSDPNTPLNGLSEHIRQTQNGEASEVVEESKLQTPMGSTKAAEASISNTATSTISNKSDGSIGGIIRSNTEHLFSQEASKPSPAFGTALTNADSKASFLSATPATTSVPSFSFGLSQSNETTQARPKTPEQNLNHDRMDESPTRETPTAKSSGSNFGAGGDLNSTSSSFTFGDSKVSSGTAAPFAFHRTSSSAKPSDINPSEASSGTAISNPNPFSFGSASQTTTPSSMFTFGSQPQDAVSTPFRFGSQQGSASSVSFGTGVTQANTTINSPVQGLAPLQNESRATTPFSFNSPTSAPHNPFNFGGSQPSSPALSASGLPTTPGGSATTAFQFGSGAGTTGESSLFTIGAPPPAQQGRTTKGLPKRRANVRR